MALPALVTAAVSMFRSSIPTVMSSMVRMGMHPSGLPRFMSSQLHHSSCSRFSSAVSGYFRKPTLLEQCLRSMKGNAFVPLIPCRSMSSLGRMHRLGPPIRKRKKNRHLDGRPQLKGLVLKTIIMKPRKPNSANRKGVLVRLSNGKEAKAYVPGIGHNLQEHNIVLIEGCQLRDVPGVRLRVVRGKYDCRHVEKPSG